MNYRSALVQKSPTYGLADSAGTEVTLAFECSQGVEPRNVTSRSDIMMTLNHMWSGQTRSCGKLTIL